MPFFIRKKDKFSLTQSLATGKNKGKFSKKSVNKRKSQTKEVNQRKHKRPKQSGSNIIPDKLINNGNDEEITSESEDEEVEVAKKTDFSEDGTLDEDEETAQDKKLRLAKLYLEQIEDEEKKKQDAETVDPDLIASRLREDVLEQAGRLRKEVADFVQPDMDNSFVLACPKYLKRSVTCLAISEDDQYIYSGSKDGVLIKWCLKTKKKLLLVKRKEQQSVRKLKKGVQLKIQDSNVTHCSAITSIALTCDSKFLVTGDLDGQVVVWNPHSLERMHIFKGHRKAIRGLVFRKKSHTLFSCSDDRTVRIWSLDEMGYVETLFGHQDCVTCIDALSRERAITGGGRDNSIRIWKIAEESQLVYNGHCGGNIDCVKLINEENFVSGGEDGSLCLWTVNRKKPLYIKQGAHRLEDSDKTNVGNNWISCLSCWTNTDLIASGSCDGYVRFWKCAERFKNLSEAFKIPIQGWINCLQFNSGDFKAKEKFLAVGLGKEHRLGRWFKDIKVAKNCILVIPLTNKS